MTAVEEAIKGSGNTTGSNKCKLPLRKLGDLAREVDARGPRRWLIRGVWPAGDYGIHAAEVKTGKTWNALDLAVSVASGTPWLDALPVDTTGSVIVFAGEGGDGNIVRRLRAIATARGLLADELPIHVCTRAPRLTDDAQVQAVAEAVAAIKPALVVIDPLYLAAAGAKGAEVYAMGAVLEPVQHACQGHGAALLVIHHYNRSRELKGAARLSGAGPAEWGRVLLAADAVDRRTDPDTLATAVTVDLRVIGGEVPDQTIRIRRTIRADDPDDLNSPLRYHVELLDADAPTPASDDRLSPAARKLLAALTALARPATIRELVDWVVQNHGHGLRRETCSRELHKLADLQLADCLNPSDKEKLWELIS